MARLRPQAAFEKKPALLDSGVEQDALSYPHIDEIGHDVAWFFTQSMDLLCIAGLDDGYFKTLNPAWTTRLGWRIEDLLGKPFIDFVHADDRQRTLNEVSRLASGKRAICFENRYRHVDGSYRWLQWNARPHQRQQRIYAVARDVTSRKRHEREILEIVDRERGRLGREMHDGLCQSLAGIAAMSAALSRKLAATAGADAAARADEISKLLKDAIADARDMARGLDPIGLDSVNLANALEKFACNVQHMFPVSCRAECRHEDLRLEKDVATHLFRIAQEAVANSVTHGRAGRILIRLSSGDNECILRVEDNGTGLPQDSSRAGGMGLRTMTYRARLINASVEISRHKERGTVVTCILPLPA